MTERDVQKQVLDFLRERHWRPVRMTVGRFRSRVFVGERGMCDWLFLRYARYSSAVHQDHFFWLELKRPGEKPSPHQLAWIEAERVKGALVCVADSLEAFQNWYKENVF